jgi:tetratricopeptide (TPR) repeat protein
MRSLPKIVLLSVALGLAACASVPAPQPERPAAAVEGLFDDGLFGLPGERVGAHDLFALTDEMRRYAGNDMAAAIRRFGAQEALVESLYRNGRLQLEYESASTRTAAQAFEARAGNCLSLVILTAAFAKELGLQVRYQSAYVDEAWTRRGNLLLRSGHVNITLGRRLADHGVLLLPQPLTIDFLPPEDLRGLKTVEIPESLVIAMFLNNRAVERLVEDRLDDAYAWAREAVRTDPGFLAAQNTLGVVYLRRGALSRAERVFDHVLALDPGHTRALANLIEVASREGRTADAERLRARLAQLEAEPPLHLFNQGLAAMQREDFRTARDLFARAAAREDAAPEVHYWLGVAHYRLGELEQASRELARAADASASRSERQLYSAKLRWLRAQSAN